MALKLNSIKREMPKDGEWIDIPEWTGVRLKVRSIDSRDYQIAREMLVQKLTRTLGRLPTSPEMEPQLGKLVATHLLRGWDGIVDGPDVPDIPKEGTKEVIEAAKQAAEAALAAQVVVEWTPKVGLEYLANPDYRELEQQVIWAANRVGNRDAEFTVDAVKNSEVPSATI